MKFLKYVFLLFGAFEIWQGVSLMSNTVSFFEEITSLDPALRGNYLVYAKGYGNATLIIGVLSILSFFTKDKFIQYTAAGMFILYSLSTAFFYLETSETAGDFTDAGYFHLVFAAAFAVYMIFNAKKARTSFETRSSKK